MPRVVAFGDSFTYGQGLPDIGCNPGPATPSKYAYPQILGDLLGYDVCNAASQGASNKEIWFRLMSCSFEPDDIVIVVWTAVERHCVIYNEVGPELIRDDSWLTKVAAWYTDAEQGSPEKTITDAYYTHLYNAYDSTQQTYGFIHHTELYLQSLDVRYLQTGIPHFSPAAPDNPFMFADHIDISDKLMYPTFAHEEYLYGNTPDNHVSQKGHEKFAFRILEYLGLQV